MKKFQAILFDLDGVLVDACEWHYIALNKALEMHNELIIERKEHESKFNGLPTLVKLNMMNIDIKKAIEINNTKQKITLEIISENALIMPEKIELHNWLKSNDIKIGCVTNSIRQTTIEMLKKTGQYDYMDIIICNEDVKHNKPHPDCYNLAIQKLKLNPEYVVCVEDSEKGIKAAKKSEAKYLIPVNNTKDVSIENIKTKLEAL